MAKKRGKPKGKNSETVVILPGIYNETLTLLAEAHDYFHRFGSAEQMQMSARERTMYASEMSRITIRLSCVMAWLMTRKAVFIGKLSEQEANASYRLDCRDVCLNQHIEAETVMPPRLNELLDKSYELYRRVARLDEAAGKEG